MMFLQSLLSLSLLSIYYRSYTQAQARTVLKRPSGPHVVHQAQARAASVTACASTKGINPLPIHSHNDYTRNHPLCDALANSASSIEADVWWVANSKLPNGGTLYVAHTAGSEKASNTLDSLYIQPLLTLLNARNPNGVKPDTKPSGLWEDHPEQTIQLLIDFKSSGEDTFQPVVNALKPLADAGYLTTYVNGTLVERAITVVGSGNTPFDRVQAMSPRTIFYDAPLNQLASHPEYSDPTISPLASADFIPSIGWLGIFSITSGKRQKIKSWFAEANQRGIKGRFYGTPALTTGNMKRIWAELLSDSVDGKGGAMWLNVDHLTTARDYYNNWQTSH